jgi:hypothetical protein
MNLPTKIKESTTSVTEALFYSFSFFIAVRGNHHQNAMAACMDFGRTKINF